jgi:ATP-dependent RNA circularization protein (DNA/RNA ligase family)
MKKIGRNLFLRGEHIGPKIQSNIYGLKETDVYLFDVYNLDTKEMMPYDEMKQFCSDNDFKMVPVLDDEFTLPETVGELLEYSNGFSKLKDDVLREGIVIRLRDNPKVSFKVRSPKYLAEQAKKREKEKES